MTSYSLSNVLLPAVFISSAVFSTLTVPLALIKSEPVVVEVPPLFSGEIQPIFNGEHKEVAIPYVGFAIVVSVGAGIASVEVIRRWQAYRESLETQELLPNLQQNSTGQEANKDAIKQPEYRPEASAIDFSTKAEENAPVSENLNLSSSLQENNSVQFESSRVGSQEAVQDLDLALSQIIESRHLYQTSRIKVPHIEQRLFAILFEGQYYSFFRAEKTKEKALELTTKLSHRVQKTVVTKTEKGYVIWAFEPEVSSKTS